MFMMIIGVMVVVLVFFLDVCGGECCGACELL